MIKFDPKKEVTQKLKFKPDPKLGNLCLGILESVSLEFSETDVTDEKGNPNKWEFAGMKVPRLIFVFRNIPKTESDPDRFHFYSESVVTQTKNDGSPVSSKRVESMYGSMFDRLIHIYNAFENAPNFKPLDVESEIDESADAETRVKQTTKLFKDLANCFNKGKDEKTPIYKDGDTYIKILLKLVADFKTGSRLEIPNFVGEGFIEMYDPKKSPTIEIKPNETVELTSKKQSPSEVAKGGAEDQDKIPDDVQAMIDKAEGRS